MSGSSFIDSRFAPWHELSYAELGKKRKRGGAWKRGTRNNLQKWDMKKGKIQISLNKVPKAGDEFKKINSINAEGGFLK